MTWFRWERSQTHIPVLHKAARLGRARCGTIIPGDADVLDDATAETILGRCAKCATEKKRGVGFGGFSDGRRGRLTHQDVTRAVARFVARGGVVLRLPEQPAMPSWAIIHTRRDWQEPFERIVG